MPSSGGRSAPKRSNTAAIEASSAASAATSTRVVPPAASSADRSARPVPRRDTATTVEAPMSASWRIRYGPTLPVAPITRWLVPLSSLVSGTAGSGRGSRRGTRRTPLR